MKICEKVHIAAIANSKKANFYSIALLKLYDSINKKQVRMFYAFKISILELLAITW